MTNFCVLVSFLVAVPFDTLRAAEAYGFCFAFLQQGDVVVNCQGKVTRITYSGGRIESFSISDETGYLALGMSHVTARNPFVATAVASTGVVDLRGGTAWRLDGVGEAVSTCGGLFLTISSMTYPNNRDLITGRELAFQLYKSFRCSSNRRVVIGLTNRSGVLHEGYPPKAKTGSHEVLTARRFNISPNGSHVAYYGNRLCVQSTSRAAECVVLTGAIDDVPSVNDLGEVLVSVGTGEECYYRAQSDFYARPFPGAKDENRDECMGVGYFKTGLQSVKVIEPIGRNPQWISPATAELVIRWGGQQAKGAAR